MHKTSVVMGLLLLLSCAAGVLAQTQPTTRPATKPAPQKVDPKLSVTAHEMSVGGQILKYKATAGYMPVKDETGKEKANFFFVAYEKDRPDAVDASQRPVMFVFNGGPGAAAVWLHLGAVGPKRAKLANDLGDPPAPPYQLLDNDQTWLDVTDLVFIDPIGTGYSRPAPDEKGEQFYGVREDVASVAEFIRLYITKHQRWLSPKFLAGESYGTTRAAGLSEYLAARCGITLNGVILISVVLDFQTIQAGETNDLPYVLYLPSYAATAWYHKTLPEELQRDLDKTIKEVKQFAVNEYMPALARDGDMTDEQRRTLVEKLAWYTGLPPEFIDRSNLRVGPGEFRKMLLADKRLVTGRFDARIVGFDRRPAEIHADYDPSLPGYLGAYSATFNDYVRRQLGYENDLAYEVLSDKVQPWNFGRGGGYLDVSRDLRSAMVQNPHLKVMFAAGYFDLATPFFGTDYTVDHLNLSKDLRANVTQTYYPAGHMMYHHRVSLEKLKADVKAFVAGALGTSRT